MTVTAQHLVGQTPRCRSARLALPATPSALAWQGSLGLDQPAERTALWLFRGLKLIKELRLAFISSCVPAIYMLMPALPLRRSPARATRAGVLPCPAREHRETPLCIHVAPLQIVRGARSSRVWKWQSS